MLFSEEIDNAIKLGYKSKILRDYTFKKENIFNLFVTELYNIQLQYSKDNPINYIAKILLNSLYGQIEINDKFTYNIFISKNSYLKYKEQNIDKILNVMNFEDNYLVEVENDKTRAISDNRTETHNINISIASTVTAYARVLMFEFKNTSMLKIYYTDTNFIYTDLNSDNINKIINNIVDFTKLGKLKLESISTVVIFISPKVYYLKTQDLKEIYKVKGLTKDSLLT